MRELQMKPQKSKRIPLWLAVLALLLLIFGWQAIAKNSYLPVDPQDKSPVQVRIPDNSNAGQVARILKDNDLIRSERTFVKYCARENLDSRLKAGVYGFSRSQTLQEISIQIAEGKGMSNVFTIPEGFTLQQIGDLLVKKGLVSADEWQSALLDEYDYDFLPARGSKTRLEGFLFPDTYSAAEKTSAHEIVDRMLANFNRHWDQECTKLARQRQMSVGEVVIVASLIEKEARVPSERTRIAGVIYNRLKIGMPLQIDATVLYSLGQHKEWVSNKDLQVDSPYNTYRHTGLPPGPIACPGLASIKAALNPETHGYYYYVAKGDGSHHFSKTFAEHEQARQKYQR